MREWGEGLVPCTSFDLSMLGICEKCINFTASKYMDNFKTHVSER